MKQCKLFSKKIKTESYYIEFNNRSNFKIDIPSKAKLILKKIFKTHVSTSFFSSSGLKNIVSISDYKVPDVWRYVISIDSMNNVNKLFLCQSLKKSVYPDRDIPEIFSYTKRIILLLESPHKDEFYFKNGILTTKAPAQGATGGNINFYITNIIEDIIKQAPLSKGTYDLLIVNPVPYMASLGVFYDGGMEAELKENVWNTFWGIKDITDDFEKRCIDYKPSLILNFCTKGKKIKMQEKITSFIMNISNLNTIPIWNGNHPSIWQVHGFNLKKIR